MCNYLDQMSGTNNARAALEPSWMSTDNAGGGNGGGSGSQLPKSNGIEGSNGAVKTETNQPKSSGFKPKFVPKVPVKKEAAPAATTTRYSCYVVKLFVLFSYIAGILFFTAQLMQARQEISQINNHQRTIIKGLERMEINL